MDESSNDYIDIKIEILEDGTCPEQPQNGEPMQTVNVRLLDQFCRLCLRQRPDLVPLLSRIQDMSVPEVFRAITGFEMSLEDSYPLEMCRTCMAMLDFAFDIRQNFTESYQILQEFLMSKTQPLVDNLSEYQGGMRAAIETHAERLLREYRDPERRKETVDQHKVAPKLNPCVIIPQPPEKPIELPVQIKHEPELILEPEEHSSSTVTVEETNSTDDESSDEVMLHEYRDLRSQKETVDEHKAAPQMNPCVSIPHAQEIKHEPELILEPDELPDPDAAITVAITNDAESSTEEFCKTHKFALQNHLDPYQCYICNDIFETNKDVQIHLTQHVDMIPYECSACTKETGRELKIFSLNLLHRHFQIHARAIKCPECPYQPRTKKALLTHMRKKHGEYICNRCGKKFISQSFLDQHMVTHNAANVVRFACSYCDKHFPCKGDQVRHEQRHTGKERYQCLSCSKIFKTKCELNRHEQIHTGEKPHKCDACARSFRLRWMLTRHISKVHSKTEQKDDGPILTCQFEGCDFSTTNKPKYYHHRSKHDLRFQCSQCSRRFTTRPELQKHQIVHTGVKYFPCEQCDKGFQSKTSLKEHVASHNNDRPYICDICGFSFVRKRNLKEHMLKHSSQLSYKCKHCGLKFKYRRTHAQHEKRHLEEDGELVDSKH